MKVFFRKTDFGFQYQKEGDTAWTYFPNGINTIYDVRTYFQDNDIVFVNQQGVPAKLYIIKPGEKIAGQRIATVDHGRKFVFDDITTDAEKLEFLRYHIPEDNEVEALEIDKDKVTAYLKKADEELKKALKNMIADKLTPEVIKELCEKNSRDCYQLPAEVIFEE